MPSVPMPIREAKELVDSGRPYLKPSTKEKKRKEKEKVRKRDSRKAKKSHTQGKKVHQEKSGKSSPQDMVPGQMGTQYQ